MRLVKRNIDVRAGSGSATMIPQEPEDIWHAHNLLRPGDILTAPAIRKVKMGSAEKGSGSTSTKTIRTTLHITIQKLDFDAQGQQLHVAGRVCAENEHVSLGSHHTLDLELNRQFTLTKENGGWDSIALEQLQQACDPRSGAKTWAVVMQEGLACICVITEYQTILRQRVEVSIPRKRTGAGADAHDKGLDKFFDTVWTTLRRHMQVDEMLSSSSSTSTPSTSAPANSQPTAQLPPLLLASPGFVAQGFSTFLRNAVVKENNKALIQYINNNIIVAHSSSGYVHALSEVLREPNVQARLSNTKFARDSQVMDRFMSLVRQDDGRAWYGPKEVFKAVNKGAVGRGGGILLLSERLFRADTVQERKKWVGLVEKVKGEWGGEVRVMSAMHESGKRLEDLGEIGAILTFPIENLDEEEDEEPEQQTSEIPPDRPNGGIDDVRQDVENMGL